MLTIQYREPIWLDGTVVKTRMALTKDSPYHFNTVIVDGDHRETAVEVLLPLAMEALHKDLFVDKAMPEAIQKVEDLNAKMAEVDAFLVKAKADMATIQEQADLAQGSIVEATEMLFDHEMRILALEGTTDETTETNLEGGE